MTGWHLIANFFLVTLAPSLCAPRICKSNSSEDFYMKKYAAIGALVCSFLLWASIGAFAQDEHHEREEEKKAAEHQEERHDEHKAEEHHADEHRAKEHRRIADEHWRAHFGREHHFAVRHVEVVNGVRRFDYSGYHFGLVEPWPAGWGYNDDVYIDLVGDQYYLFNVRHPGVRIAVNVVP
jgi:hypothetical protein